MSEPTAPPSDDLVASVLARHKERVASLEHLGRAERAMGAELQRTLNLSAPTEKGGLLGRIFKSRPTRELKLQALWQRHEQAVEKVRALGHHVQALEMDLSLLQRDLEAVGEGACKAARERESLEQSIPGLQAELARHEAASVMGQGAAALAADLDADRVRSRLWSLQTEAERLQALEDRQVGLLEILRETRSTMERLHGSLRQLRDAGTSALTDMERRLTTLAAGATARDLAEQTARAMDALRETLHEVSNLADENATFLDERVDALDARMRLLDARSETERKARDEVESSLHGADK